MEGKQMQNSLKNSLKDFLDVVVEEPAFETLEKDANSVDKLIWVHNLWMNAIPEVEKKRLTETETIWVTALPKELTWAIVSVLSGSYASSFMIMQNVFEMLIRSVAIEGPIGKRISDIAFLDDDEKTEFKDLWRNFGAIAHPYEKWFKILPFESWTYFRYNRTACKYCVDYLLRVSDFMMVVALEKGFCEPENVSEGINALGLKFSQKRLEKLK